MDSLMDYFTYNSAGRFSFYLLILSFSIARILPMVLAALPLAVTFDGTSFNLSSSSSPNNRSLGKDRLRSAQIDWLLSTSQTTVSNLGQATTLSIMTDDLARQQSQVSAVLCRISHDYVCLIALTNIWVVWWLEIFESNGSRPPEYWKGPAYPLLLALSGALSVVLGHLVRIARDIPAFRCSLASLMAAGKLHTVGQIITTLQQHPSATDLSYSRQFYCRDSSGSTYESAPSSLCQCRECNKHTPRGVLECLGESIILTQCHVLLLGGSVPNPNLHRIASNLSSKPISKSSAPVELVCFATTHIPYLGHVLELGQIHDFYEGMIGLSFTFFLAGCLLAPNHYQGRELVTIARGLVAYNVLRRPHLQEDIRECILSHENVASIVAEIVNHVEGLAAVKRTNVLSSSDREISSIRYLVSYLQSIAAGLLGSPEDNSFRTAVELMSQWYVPSETGPPRLLIDLMNVFRASPLPVPVHHEKLRILYPSNLIHRSVSFQLTGRLFSQAAAKANDPVQVRFSFVEVLMRELITILTQNSKLSCDDNFVAYVSDVCKCVEAVLCPPVPTDHTHVADAVAVGLFSDTLFYIIANLLSQSNEILTVPAPARDWSKTIICREISFTAKQPISPDSRRGDQLVPLGTEKRELHPPLQSSLLPSDRRSTIYPLLEALSRISKLSSYSFAAVCHFRRSFIRFVCMHLGLNLPSVPQVPTLEHVSTISLQLALVQDATYREAIISLAHQVQHLQVFRRSETSKAESCQMSELDPLLWRVWLLVHSRLLSEIDSRRSVTQPASTNGKRGRFSFHFWRNRTAGYRKSIQQQDKNDDDDNAFSRGRRCRSQYDVIKALRILSNDILGPLSVTTEPATSKEYICSNCWSGVASLNNGCDSQHIEVCTKINPIEYQMIEDSTCLISTALTGVITEAEKLILSRDPEMILRVCAKIELTCRAAQFILKESAPDSTAIWTQFEETLSDLLGAQHETITLCKSCRVQSPIATVLCRSRPHKVLTSVKCISIRVYVTCLLSQLAELSVNRPTAESFSHTMSRIGRHLCRVTFLLIQKSYQSLQDPKLVRELLWVLDAVLECVGSGVVSPDVPIDLLLNFICSAEEENLKNVVVIGSQLHKFTAPVGCLLIVLRWIVKFAGCQMASSLSAYLQLSVASLDIPGSSQRDTLRSDLTRGLCFVSRNSTQTCVQRVVDLYEESLDTDGNNGGTTKCSFWTIQNILSHLNYKETKEEICRKNLAESMPTLLSSLWESGGCREFNSGESSVRLPLLIQNLSLNPAPNGKVGVSVNVFRVLEHAGHLLCCPSCMYGSAPTYNSRSRQSELPARDVDPVESKKMVIAVQVVGQMYVALYATRHLSTLAGYNPPISYGEITGERELSVESSRELCLEAALDWCGATLSRLVTCGQHYQDYMAAHAFFCLNWVHDIEVLLNNSRLVSLQPSLSMLLLPLNQHLLQTICMKQDFLNRNNSQDSSDDQLSDTAILAHVNSLLFLASSNSSPRGPDNFTNDPTAAANPPEFSQRTFIDRVSCLDVLVVATSSDLHGIVWGAGAIKDYGGPACIYDQRAKHLWQSADLRDRSNRHLQLVTKDPLSVLSWWLVNLGLNLTQMTHNVTETFSSRIVPKPQTWTRCIWRRTGQMCVLSDVLLSRAIDVSTELDLGVLSEIVAKEYPRLNSLGAAVVLDTLSHGFSFRDIPNKLREVVRLRKKRRHHRKMRHRRSAFSYTNVEPYSWVDDINAVSMSVAFHRFEDPMTWPVSRDIEVLDCSEVEATTTELYLVLAMKELLCVIARYRHRAAGATENPSELKMLRHIDSRRRGIESQHIQHQPVHAQLALVELLVRDELLRHIVWYQLSSNDIIDIPSIIGSLSVTQLSTDLSNAHHDLSVVPVRHLGFRATARRRSLCRPAIFRTVSQGITSRTISCESVRGRDRLLTMVDGTTDRLSSLSSSSISSLESRNRELSLVREVQQQQTTRLRVPTAPQRNKVPLDLFVQRRGKLPLTSLRLSDQKRSLWQCLLEEAWDIAPAVMSQLLDRFPTTKSLRRVARKFIAREPDVALWCMLIAPGSNSRFLEFVVMSGSLYTHESTHSRIDSAVKTHFQSRCCSRQATIQSGGSEKVVKISLPFPWLYQARVPIEFVLPLLHRRHAPQIHLKLSLMSRSLERETSDSFRFIILQLIQALRWDKGRLVENLLSDVALVYPSISQTLMFLLSTESRAVSRLEGRRIPNWDPDLLPAISLRLKIKLSKQNHLVCLLKDCMSSNMSDYKALSGSMFRVPPTQRQSHLKLKLKELPNVADLSPPLYLPTDPKLRVMEMLTEDVTLMQSAVKFKVERFSGVDRIRQKQALKGLINSSQHSPDHSGESLQCPEQVVAVIFKLNDDIRQDHVALQIIEYCQALFDRIKLPLRLTAYRVIPHRPGGKNGMLGGMIQVVPNAISRHQMGRTYECSLSDYFRNVLGGNSRARSSNSSSATVSGTDQYRHARWQFLRSLAAYAVVSFLLQVKDRHNGNLLITDDGQLIHIDFGFLFDLSPGRDMRLERAPFKLTAGRELHVVLVLIDWSEMIEILGGSAQSETFKLFEQLVIRGYLVIRQEAHVFLDLLAVMVGSGLPCFKGNSLSHFRERFQLERGPEAAAEYMRQQILVSYNALSTRLYDVVQSIQQGIKR